MPTGETRLRGLRWIGGTALLALTGLALPNALVARAARGQAYASPAAVPVRTVAIVPGAAVFDGRPLRSLTERLQTALALYRNGRVRAILVSGHNTGAAPEVAVMKSWLVARGVPPGAIWSDGAGSRTRQTMLNAAGFFGVTDAIVCTQDLYLARALFLAHHAGINAVGVGVPTRLAESPRGAGTEVLKTTLAVVESYLRRGPIEDGSAGRERAALALR